MSGKPLSGDAKAKVGTFLGIQLLRGPRWFAWHTAFNEKNFEKYREEGQFKEAAEKHGVTEDEVVQAMLDKERQDSQVTMLRFGAKAGTVLASMHRTVIHFPKPWLATSDHPVAVWPKESPGDRAPEPVDVAAIGLINFSEARLPLSPTAGLLMTWQHSPDPPEAVMCDRKQAVNFNAFTLAEAESQWFRKPEVPRPPTSGPPTFPPLAADLYPSYSTDVVDQDPRRREVWIELDSRIGADLDDPEVLKAELVSQIRFIEQPGAIHRLA